MPPADPRAPIAVDTVRWIDRWIGVPICWVLTIVRRLGVFAGRGDERPRRALFVELAEMGTTVLAYPAIARFRQRYPDSELHFLIFRHIDESIRVLDLIPDANVWTIDVSSVWSLTRDTFRFMTRARRARIDTVINLEAVARFSMILTFLAGARRRVGFHTFGQPGSYTGDLLTHRVRYNPHIHTWQALVALVETLDEPLSDVPMAKFPAPSGPALPVLTTDASARERIAGLFGPQRALAGQRLIVINPNASRQIPVRRWPLDRYAELVRRLASEPRFVCVLIGSPPERDDAEYIVSRAGTERVVDLSGRTSLRELIDLLNMAELLVTNDSGPAHFAAVTSVKTLVFFGPETPVLYGPLTSRAEVLYANYACSPCVTPYNQRRSPCNDNKCLQHFSVDDVLAIVNRMLT
jgi:ADP-heptose:LPS heptosyltransferase